MKVRFRILVPLLLVPVLLAAGYYLITPRLVLVNESESSYAEFVIDLPSSRVSFSPVAASSSATIFYSQQGRSGESSYSLRQSGRQSIEARFIYPPGSELGRVLRFTIASDGSVSLD
jgi:hypothetical protein